MKDVNVRIRANVDLLISSEAKRVTQRANGAWIYLRDENDTHYEPTPNPAEVPLDVLLQPGESVAAQRDFRCRRTSASWAWCTGHGGQPCGFMSLVIIGKAAACFTSRP